MMLLGSLVNMLAIFAGCFVGVTLGRFIPERFNSAIEKGIALCVLYIGLDGVLAGSDTLVAILSMVLGVILGELLDLDGRIHALGDWVERRFAKKQSKTSISEGFVNASLLSVDTVGDEQIAQVYFNVLLREDPSQEAPIDVREIWHFVRPASGDGTWKLDGIQQVENV